MKKQPGSCLRAGLAVLAGMVAATVLCRTALLWHNAVVLDIPDPPNSRVRTTRYWSDLLDSYHVWDREYRVPMAALGSVENVEHYFDSWFTEHDWVQVEDGFSLSSSKCLTGRGLTNEDLAESSVSIYTTQEWLDRPQMKAPFQACLVVTTQPLDGFYIVRLLTLHPTLLYDLNM